MSSKHKLFKELEFLGFDPISIRNVLLSQNTFEGALEVLSQNKEQHIRSELVKFGVPVRMARRLAGTSSTVDEAYSKFNEYLPVADAIRSQIRDMGYPSNSAEFLISEMVPLEQAIDRLLTSKVPEENITIQIPRRQVNSNFAQTPPTMNPVPVIQRPPLELPRPPQYAPLNTPPPYTGMPPLPNIPQGVPGLPPLPNIPPPNFHPFYNNQPRGPPPLMGSPQPYFNYPPPQPIYAQPPPFNYPPPNFPPPNYPGPPNHSPYNSEEPNIIFQDDRPMYVPQEQQSLPRRRAPQPVGQPLNPDASFNIIPGDPEPNRALNRNTLGNNFQEAYETVTIAQMNRNTQDPNEEIEPLNPLFDLFLVLENFGGIYLINLLGSMYEEEVGVSEDVFQKLDREKYSNALGLSTDNCVICMEDFEMDLEIVVLPCKHGFHTDCIASWLKKSELCPLCKAEVTGELGVN